MYSTTTDLGRLTRFVAVTLITMGVNASFGAERPNIILIMGDDHGWDETGYNGHPHLKTPVLDEMATGGLRLNQDIPEGDVLLLHIEETFQYPTDLVAMRISGRVLQQVVDIGQVIVTYVSDEAVNE